MTTRPRDSTPSLNEPPLIPMVKKLSVRLRRLWRMIHCFKRVRTGSLWCKSGWPLSGSKSRMYLIWLATWSGQRRTCDSSALRWYLASVTGLGGSFQFPFFCLSVFYFWLLLQNSSVLMQKDCLLSQSPKLGRSISWLSSRISSFSRTFQFLSISAWFFASRFFSVSALYD